MAPAEVCGVPRLSLVLSLLCLPELEYFHCFTNPHIENRIMN